MKHSEKILCVIAISAVAAGSLQAQQIEEIVVAGNPIGELGLDEESDAGSWLSEIS